jgi:hypothetical protein
MRVISTSVTAFVRSRNADPDIRDRTDRLPAEAGYPVPGHEARPREPLVDRRMQALVIVCVVALVWYFHIATNPMVIRHVSWSG